MSLVINMLPRVNIVLPPNRFRPNGKYTVFLAGSIEMGKADDWQSDFCDEFQLYDIVVLNPRRTEWDSSWVQSIDNPHFREQVEWELRCLSISDLILMYLQPNTMSPISMLELGLYANSGKMVVCCPDGFWRKGNIDIVCENHNIISCETIQDLYAIARNKIKRLS